MNTTEWELTLDLHEFDEPWMRFAKEMGCKRAFMKYATYSMLHETLIKWGQNGLSSQSLTRRATALKKLLMATGDLGKKFDELLLHFDCTKFLVTKLSFDFRSPY